MSTKLLYHFVGNKLRDGREVPPDGEWLEHGGPIRCCESGLHACEHPFDALRYAPGFTLCLVVVEGIEDRQDDKVAARRRRIVKRIDMKEQILQFARDQAKKVLHLWDAPQVVIDFLNTGQNASAADAATAYAADYATAKLDVREEFLSLVKEVFA